MCLQFHNQPFATHVWRAQRALRLALCTPSNQQLSELQRLMVDWNFGGHAAGTAQSAAAHLGVLQPGLEELFEGGLMVHVTMYALRHYNLIRHFRLDEEVLVRLLRTIQSKYLQVSFSLSGAPLMPIDLTR